MPLRILLQFKMNKFSNIMKFELRKCKVEGILSIKKWCIEVQI